MDGIAHIEEPTACTEPERREFARLVRRAFRGSDEGLDGRIRAARWLAFYYTAADTLAGIAGLKAPSERYRIDVFRKAGAGVSPVDYELELGWVFVLPAHRGNRIGENLCRLLLARAPASRVFATTRPGNSSMIRILSTLGFARVGEPYRRRGEELALFLLANPLASPRTNG